MLRNTIGELTFVDDNNQFLWYNRPVDPNVKMKAKRVPAQVGNTMGEVHPDVRDVFRKLKKLFMHCALKRVGMILYICQYLLEILRNWFCIIINALKMMRAIIPVFMNGYKIFIH